VRYRLLGPVQIVDDGRPVEVEGTKTRALLAIMLINANVVLSVDRLIEDLWGDQPPRTAVGTLHAYVSRLRSVLGPHVLVTKRPGYELVAPPEELDVARFERLLERGRSTARTGRSRQAVVVLREALGRAWRSSVMRGSH
jgi:DNA-binding SARP family transcriptional activator